MTASLLTDVEDGSARLNVKPMVSRECILREGRHPYNVWRGIVHAAVMPWISTSITWISWARGTARAVSRACTSATAGPRSAAAGATPVRSMVLLSQGVSLYLDLRILGALVPLGSGFDFLGAALRLSFFYPEFSGSFMNSQICCLRLSWIPWVLACFKTPMYEANAWRKLSSEIDPFLRANSF